MLHRLALCSPLLLALAACSSTPDTVPSPSTGGSPSGGGGSAGSASTGGGGQPGLGGSNGGVSAGGSGGSAGVSAGGAGGGGGAASGGGSAGSAGTGGGAGGCVELGSPGKTGKQCDPGSDGNGTFDQIEPTMNRPVEAEGAMEGVMSDVKFVQSTVYGYSFSYNTYKPAAYQPGKPAALMIFQDGGNYSVNFRAPQVFDKLIKEGTVPVIISVYINPSGDKRSVEYDTRSDKYGQMITTELVPELAKTFDLVDDPNGWAIGGHSSGGSCAFNVAWWFPNKFRKVMTHSGSFVKLQDPGDDAYIDLIKTEMPPKPIRTTLQSGTMDLGNGKWFNANNSMADSFTMAGYPYRYMKSTTEHGPTKWHIVDFPVAMRWLWKGYTLPHYAATP